MFETHQLKVNELVIPETWDNVHEFGKWWIENGMPYNPPYDQEVFLSDDATAISFFRKGHFQVEMYLIHPDPLVPVHEHPGVEVIKARVFRNPDDHSLYAQFSPVLHEGESHGVGMRLEGAKIGFTLFAIQHWLTRTPTTIASMWKGPTVGEKQENLIRRFNSDAFIHGHYADITKPADYLNTLRESIVNKQGTQNVKDQITDS